MRFVTSSPIVSRRHRTPSGVICVPSTCPRRADRRTGGGHTILSNRSFRFPKKCRDVRRVRFYYVRVVYFSSVLPEVFVYVNLQ